jgi:hypothetical protein
MTGCWRELHNERFRNLYPSPRVIRIMGSRRMRSAGIVTSISAKRNAYMLLMAKPEGKKPLGTPRRSWKYNIKKDIR